MRPKRDAVGGMKSETERERERDGEASGWSSGRRLSTWAQFHRLFESFYTCEGAAVVHPPPR